MKNIEVKIVKKINKNFLSDWYALWRISYNKNFYNSPEWFLTCCKTFNIRKYLILVLKKGEEIKVIAPFVSDSLYKFKVLTNPGSVFLDKSALLFRNQDEESASKLIEVLKKFGSFYLPEVEEKLVRDIEKSQIKRMLILESSINPYIPLNQNPLGFLSKKQKSKIKNKYLKYKNYLRFLRVRNKKVLSYIKVIKKIDVFSSKFSKGKVTINKKTQNLIKNLADTCRFNNLDLSILYYLNRPIVFNLGICSQKFYYAKFTSFVKDFSFLSPGKILLYLLLPRLKKEGFLTFDFSRGESVLKKEFTPFFKRHYSVYYSENYLILFTWLSIYLFKKLILSQQSIYSLLLRLRKNLGLLRLNFLQVK